MKPLDETSLDQLLGTLRTAPPPEGFTARIADRALIWPQDRSLWGALQDYMADVFGTPWASPAFNLHWRLAGIVVAVLIGFSAGYTETPLPAEDEFVEIEMYGIEEPGWVNVL